MITFLNIVHFDLTVRVFVKIISIPEAELFSDTYASYFVLLI